jgi:hypothetical protein
MAEIGKRRDLPCIISRSRLSHRVPVVGGVVLMSVEKKSDEEEKDKNWWEK